MANKCLSATLAIRRKTCICATRLRMHASYETLNKHLKCKQSQMLLRHTKSACSAAYCLRTQTLM